MVLKTKISLVGVFVGTYKTAFYVFNKAFKNYRFNCPSHILRRDHILWCDVKPSMLATGPLLRQHRDQHWRACVHTSTELRTVRENYVNVVCWYSWSLQQWTSNMMSLSHGWSCLCRPVRPKVLPSNFQSWKASLPNSRLLSSNHTYSFTYKQLQQLKIKPTSNF